MNKATHRPLGLRFVVVIGFVLLSAGGVFAANQHSPIKIEKEKFTFKSYMDMGVLDFGYAARDVTVHNPGKTKVSLKVEGFANTDILKVGTEEWKLSNIHFHARGEHELGGDKYKMEMHMVHTKVGDPTKNLALGRWIVPGADNAELAKLFTNAIKLALKPADAPPELIFANGMPRDLAEWNKIPKTPAAVGDHPAVAGFDASKLVPTGAQADKRSYRYEGTLTDFGAQGTDVKWIFLHDPIRIADADYTNFVDMLKNVGLTEPLGYGNGMPVIPIGDVPGFKASSFTDVPEPATVALIPAVAGFLVLRRRRRAEA